MKNAIQRTIFLVCAALLAANSPTYAQTYGELTVKFAKDGRTEKIAPQTISENKVVTPRKGVPYTYIGWRDDVGQLSSPDHKSNVVVLSAMQTSPTSVSIGMLLARGRDQANYATKCGRNQRLCDLTASGVEHDATEKKVTLKNARLERVSLHDTDSADHLIVSGTLYYGR